MHAARPIVITEESPDYWAERGRRLGLAPNIGFCCQPFRGKPTPVEWDALVDQIRDLVNDTNLNLLVIDPLATFLPGHNENSASGMLAALLPLQTLTRLGVAVLLLHHPRKLDSAIGHSARGSGALSGYADILLELRLYPHAGESDRRRRLCGLSRFSETPRQVVIELNAEATDYTCLGDVADEAFRANWEVVRTVLLAVKGGRLTRKEILAQWPAVEAQPNEATVWRWLERAVAEGTVRREGTGRCNSPFRYWLADAAAYGELALLYAEPAINIGDSLEDLANPILPPSLRKEVAEMKKRRKS